MPSGLPESGATLRREELPALALRNLWETSETRPDPMNRGKLAHQPADVRDSATSASPPALSIKASASEYWPCVHPSSQIGDQRPGARHRMRKCPASGQGGLLKSVNFARLCLHIC